MLKFIKDCILGGIFISLGAIAYLKWGNPVIFSTGIVAVTLTGTTLVTAYVPKLCYKSAPADMLKGAVKIVPIALINCAAAWFMGSLGFVDTTAVAAAKLAQSPVHTFISAIFCGACIAVGVLLDKKEDGTPRLWVLMAFVTLFVAAGFEHVVADAFYFSGEISMAIRTAAAESAAAAGSKGYAANMISAMFSSLGNSGKAILHLFIILAGNFVGGAAAARCINT